MGTLFDAERKMERKVFHMAVKLNNIIDFFPDLDTQDTPSLQGAGCSYIPIC